MCITDRRHLHPRTLRAYGLVLLDFEDDLIFGTHLTSRKALDLAVNPRAAATYYWRETMQQIDIDGVVRKLGVQASDYFFSLRPRAVQAAAVVSTTASTLVDEHALQKDAMKLIDSDEQIVRPDDWEAFELVLDSIELWHGRTSRLHRRLYYNKGKNGWRNERLQP